MHSSPAPMRPSSPSLVRRGWKRDLLRECVEPNPGPTMEKVLKSLRSELGKKVADFEDGINMLEQKIQELHGDDLVMHEDVRRYIEQRKQEIENIFGEKRASQVVELLREVLPSAGTHPGISTATDRSSPVGLVRRSTLALPNDFFTQPITILDLDGLKATPWPLRRDGLCQKLIDIVDNYALSRNLLLVRGPFASGKTALAQLLHYHIRQTHTAYIIMLKQSGINWINYWFEQTGVAWQAIMSSDTPVYVIIDEVQIGYPKDSSLYGLWSEVKEMINSKTLQVRFIFIGSYGEPQSGGAPTPFHDDIQPAAIVSLRAHNGTPGLAYTTEEFPVLCKSFEKFCRIPIDDRSANFIYHISDGHPGIIGVTLRCLYDNRKDFNLEVGIAKDDVYKYLHSAAFHDTLGGANRAVPKFGKYPHIHDVCKQVLSNESFKAPYREEDEQLQLCLKASLLVKEDDVVMFSAPLICNKALAYFFSQTEDKPASLRDFIIAVVQRFSTRQLRDTESRDTKSRIMEGQWQQEFFRAAATLLPRDVTISPEYGREQGVVGQVDFYIAKYQWMIEVLREGLDMNAHEKRFLPGGKYAPLLNSIQEWAVIDFRGTQKQVRRHPRANTYHLSFNDDFTKFTMRDPSGNEESFTLQGDKVLATQTDRAPGTTPAKLPRIEN